MPSAPQATSSLGSVPGLGCVHLLVGSLLHGNELTVTGGV